MAKRTTLACLVQSCERPAEKRGYCPAHYKRVMKHGSPLEDKPIRGEDGQVGRLVRGYRRTRRNGQDFAVHRLVMEEIIGRPLLPSETVHHVNGVRDDNRPENLELWSKSQPCGQRVVDKVAWALEMVDRYPDVVARLRPPLRLFDAEVA